MLLFAVLGFLFFSFLLIALYVIPLATENKEDIEIYKFSFFYEKEENSSINETVNRTS